MLSPRLTNCPECANIPDLLNKIDCKLAELGNSLYNNISYMLNQPIAAGDILQLIGYKRILTYKYVNPNYAQRYSIAMIASKVIMLTVGCKANCNCNDRGDGLTTTSTSTSTTTCYPSTTTTTTTETIYKTICFTIMNECVGNPLGCPYYFNSTPSGITNGKFAYTIEGFEIFWNNILSRWESWYSTDLSSTLSSTGNYPVGIWTIVGPQPYVSETSLEPCITTTTTTTAICKIYTLDRTLEQFDTWEGTTCVGNSFVSATVPPVGYLNTACIRQGSLVKDDSLVIIDTNDCDACISYVLEGRTGGGYYNALDCNGDSIGGSIPQSSNVDIGCIRINSLVLTNVVIKTINGLCY